MTRLPLLLLLLLVTLVVKAASDSCVTDLPTQVKFHLKNQNGGTYLHMENWGRSEALTNVWNDPDPYTEFTLEKLSSKCGYRVKVVKTGTVLHPWNYAKNKADVRVFGRPDSYSEWEFYKSGTDGSYYIKNTKGNNYLHPWNYAKHNSRVKVFSPRDSWSRWLLVPTGVKVEVQVRNFQFGDVDGPLEAALQTSTPLTSRTCLEVHDTELESSISQEFSVSYTESHSWEFSTTFGMSVGVEVTAGFLGNEVTASTTFTAEQSSTKGGEVSEEVTMTKTLTISPESVGAYEMKLSVFVARDVRLPYFADIAISATLPDGTLLTGENALALVQSQGGVKGLPVKRITSTEAVLQVTGTMTSTINARTVAGTRRLSHDPVCPF